MQVALHIGEGDRVARFSERALVIAGRATDCALRLQGDERVSRHHCMLDVNPPHVRLRDFGSLNGTYLNGTKIGQRDVALPPAEGRARGEFAEHELRDGDEVRVGRTVLRVSIPAQPPARPPAAATPDAARAGLATIGRYEIRRELSRGGMGIVYLARDPAEEAPVAIKVMLPEIAAQPNAIALFLREIENTRALRHPNIVAVHDTGTADEALFLALDYCARGTVMDAVGAAGGQLPVPTAVRICVEMLDGLGHAHHAVVPHVELADGDIVVGRGVVHRDVKPQNVLFDADGVAKLADFGLSKALDKAGLTRQTRSGMVAGTPLFMARRQLTDYRFAGPEVDVWSAAATLYWMLTGKPPRDFQAGVDAMLTVLDSNAVPIRRHRPGIPPRLAEIIDYALAETPGPGYDSALELRDALEPYA